MRRFARICLRRAAARCVVAALLFMGTHAGACAAEGEMTARAAFDAGVELVRRQRFEESLRYFKAAYAMGDQSARLQFNMGVAYYRLLRFDEAREAFLRAAADTDTRDLSIYNVGLVEYAAGNKREAARRFRFTANEAHSADLRALAAQALIRTTGRDVLRARGSFSALRGDESNVIIPVSSGIDLASMRGDKFWEGRLAWADTFGDSQRWGYHLSGVMIEYDELKAGNISYGELGLDFRGPIAVQLGTSAFLVADEGYQQSTDLRVTATVFNQDAFRFAYEGGYSSIQAIGKGPEQLEGSRCYLGGTLEARSNLISAALGFRRIGNDRELAALSPDQNSVSLNLRTVIGQGVVARLSARYTDSSYKDRRKDELLEFGGELSLRLYKRLYLVLEAARHENRSTVPQLRYETEKLYGGFRVQL